MELARRCPGKCAGLRDEGSALEHEEVLTPHGTAPTVLQLNYFEQNLERPVLTRGGGGGDVRPAMEMRDLGNSIKSGGEHSI